MRRATWTGLALLNFALFLHPMDPLDFIALAASDPLRTVRECYGIQAVALFWTGAILAAFGLIARIKRIGA